MPATERHYTSGRKFIESFYPNSKLWNLLPWLFRGHADARYLLLPSLEREDSTGTPAWEQWLEGDQRSRISRDSTAPTPHYSYFAEINIVLEFARSLNARGLAPPFSFELLRDALQMEFSEAATQEAQSVKRAADRLPLAALAQHYGLPTRLLDWSWNPLTAAYFAVSGGLGKTGGSVCVWAVSADAVTRSTRASLVSLPSLGNVNLQAQSGVFTRVDDAFLILKGTESHRQLDLSMEDEGFDQAFLKITLPHEECPAAWEALSALGVAAHSVFPGPGGVATAVQERRAVMRALGRGVRPLR